MTSDPVAQWGARAHSYDTLTETWDVFRVLARRLVGAVPESATSAIDLGAGTGVVTSELLAARPDLRVTLVEPAEAMCARARERVGPGPRILVQRAEDLDPGGEVVDAVLSSAALHLASDAEVFPRVASALSEGGVFAFNLWWHSFAETADRADPFPRTRAAVERALAEAGHPSPRWPERVAFPVRERGALVELGRASGLRLERCQIDRDTLGPEFGVDFSVLTGGGWPDLAPEARLSVLERARELARVSGDVPGQVGGDVEVASVRFVFRATRSAAR